MNAFTLWVFSPALQGQHASVQNLLHLVKKDQSPLTRFVTAFELHWQAWYGINPCLQGHIPNSARYVKKSQLRFVTQCFRARPYRMCSYIF